MLLASVQLLQASGASGALLPAASLGLLRSVASLTAGQQAARNAPACAPWRPPSAIARAASQPQAFMRQHPPHHALREYATPSSPPSGPLAAATMGDGDSLPAAVNAQEVISHIAVAAPALPPRVKGIGRKMLMRQINRTLVRRLARRATIGIPMLGLFFVLRVLKKDSASLMAAWSAGDATLASLYGAAVAAELVDVVAQCTVSIGMGVTSGLLAAPAGLVALPAGLAGPLGLAALPALPAALAIADRTSLGMAATSCAMGLAAEAVVARRELRAAAAAEGAGAGAGAGAGGQM